MNVASPLPDGYCIIPRNIRAITDSLAVGTCFAATERLAYDSGEWFDLAVLTKLQTLK
jgi:hypothetical protein